jgi:hypothetical protein
MFSTNASASAALSAPRGPTRDFDKTRLRCGAPTPLARDDLEPAALDRAHQNRLHDALRANRVG